MHFPSQKTEDLLHWLFRIHPPYQITYQGQVSIFNQMDIPVNQTRAYTCCNEYESFFSYDKREKYCNWTCGDMIYKTATDKSQFSHHSILLIFITVVLRQMKQVFNQNIFYTYFKCNIACKCSVARLTLKVAINAKCRKTS
jgi:hypothetical protein